MHHESLTMGLFEAGCVKFGRFMDKRGTIAPIYLDLRLLISSPATLWQTAGALSEIIRGLPGPDCQTTRPPLTFDRIAAIPYAALPIGVTLSLAIDRPLVYPRKKPYGTFRPIEGRFEPGEKALLLDDLITKGQSKIDAIALLKEAGLIVEDVLVIVDQQQGGAEALAGRGCRLHSIMTMRDMLDILARHQAISPGQHAEVLDYMQQGENNGLSPTG
jgi:orotate phosphoribosyltransferase